MPRPKADPIERAYDAYAALSPDEQLRFFAFVAGFRRASEGAPAPLPPRKRASKKPEADSAA